MTIDLTAIRKLAELQAKENKFRTLYFAAMDDQSSTIAIQSRYYFDYARYHDALLAAARNTDFAAIATNIEALASEVERLKAALKMAELQRDLHKRTLDTSIKIIRSRRMRSSLDDKVSDSLKGSEHGHER